MVNRWLLGLLLLFGLWPLSAAAYDAGSQCVRCHADAKRMAELGAPQYVLDPAAVDREVGMDGKPTCSDCHLGDPAATDVAGAHRGMPRSLLVAHGKNLAGQAVARSQLTRQPLAPTGKSPAALVPKLDPQLAAKAGVEGVDSLLWHDHDPETLAYAPAVAKATCGKCHATEVEAYDSSNMGLMAYQRANRSFAEAPPGPHNCGAWFGQNQERLAAETAVPFSPAQAAAGDRNCNRCHAGCNDCHLRVDKGQGSHLFGMPDAVSCYGGRHGTLCHAGPMERRRGAGFLRDEYAFPTTLYAGSHAEKGLVCTDCHAFKDHQSGHPKSAEARASCARCHEAIVAAVASSAHAKVDCAACHIDEIGGYQFTFWGPGSFAGVETPYAKHAGYYGIRDQPTLIRDAEGRWLPYKPYPLAVLNQKGSLAPSGVLYRAIPKRTVPGNPAIGEPASFSVERRADQTNDALILAGTRDDLPADNRAILWIQLDKVSHALDFGAECQRCHASHAQHATSDFRYWDKRNVKGPVIGGYKVVADEKGLRFTDLHYSPIETQPGRNVLDFALFTAIPDAWNVPGDFSIPFDAERTKRAEALWQSLEGRIKTLQAATKDAARRERLHEIRAVAAHNPPEGEKLLERFTAGQ